MKALKNASGSLEEADNVVQRIYGTSTGTGSAQTITHGLGALWTHLKIEYSTSESGVVFSSFSVDEVNGKDHFHLTVTNGKTWFWEATAW